MKFFYDGLDHPAICAFAVKNDDAEVKVVADTPVSDVQGVG